jgi:cullin-associated NEDD8-dissociated protein 1
MLVPQVKNYISTSDISLLSHSLIILATLLELSPVGTFPEVERGVLSDVYSIAHSPLVSGSTLDAVLVFFAALVQADGQISAHVVPNLVATAEKAPKAESSPGNVAKCIAQVVKTQQSIAAGTIAEFSKHIKVFVDSIQLFDILLT